MKRFLSAFTFILLSVCCFAQIAFTPSSLSYYQDFDALSDTTLSNSYTTLPSHWLAKEFGSSADQTYRAAYGELAGGDLYSFGDSAIAERALGSIGSGSNEVILFGTYFKNQTTDTITSVVVQYMGEQWRQGRPAGDRSTGPDTLHFAYALNASGIDDASFIDYSNLNLSSPQLSAPLNTPTNGNLSANRMYMHDTIFGLHIAPGDTLYIRWRDYNSVSFDDGLAIDSLTVSFIPKAAQPAAPFIYIGQSGLAHFEDFNSLGNSYQNEYQDFSTFPDGWYGYEVGSNANTTYRVSYGEFAGGEIYSYGDSLSNERALGSVGSGSNTDVYYGAAFVNNTGDSLRSMHITYTGEQWRQGRPGTARATGPDTIFFGYAINAFGVNDSNFTEVDSLHFHSPENNGTLNTPLDGNATSNRTSLDFTVHNLKVANGDTVWIRWRDYNSSSFDDGLAVDSLTVTFLDTTLGGNPGNPTTSPFLKISQFNSEYLQTFDSIGSDYGVDLYHFNTLPHGWFAHEQGSNSDNTYKVAYGEFAGGNLYSFGDSLSTERAFGSIGSGTNGHSDFGPAFINTTGDTITTLEVKFVGEQWRQGRPGVNRATGPDTLHFSMAINASGIADNSFSLVPQLDFYSPENNGVLNTPLNGNDAVNQTKVQFVMVNLNILPGDTLWLRWTDYNSQSFDDGLAVDSVRVTALKNFQSTAISFRNSSQTLTEIDGTVNIPLTLTNGNDFSSQVEIFVADTGTVDLATDLSFVSANTIFQAGDTTAHFSILLNRDAPFESQEYFVLGMRNLGNASVGTIAYDTIYINNYNYPHVDIDLLKSSNSQGVADSLNGRYVIDGIVHGINYSNSGGTDFYVLQNGEGLNVYAPSGTLNYNVTEGDQVNIWGQLSQFRGLARIESIDSVNVIATGQTLETPNMVSTLDETTESDLVTLENIRLYPAIASFPSDMAVTAITSTNDTVSIYVNNQSDIAGMPAPSIPFSITGLGSQFADYNAPFVGGYRLMVISEAYSSIGLTENQVSTIRLYPNPVTTELNLNADKDILEVAVFNMAGQLIITKTPLSSAVRLNLSDLHKGTYLLRVKTVKGISTHKIVK